MERHTVDAPGEKQVTEAGVSSNEPAQSTPAPRKANAVIGMVRELVETLVIALVIVFVMNTFILQSTIVLGQSMEPTLHDYERIMLDKISYRFHQPERGDVIVFNPPNSSSIPYIKRVIGLPGETVEIHQGHVYINGKELNEAYLQVHSNLVVATNAEMPAHVVGPDEVFVLGDNRGASNDSRYFGDVKDSSIIGRALIAYWPLSRLGLIR